MNASSSFERADGAGDCVVGPVRLKNSEGQYLTYGDGGFDFTSIKERAGHFDTEYGEGEAQNLIALFEKRHRIRLQLEIVPAEELLEQCDLCLDHVSTDEIYFSGTVFICELCRIKESNSRGARKAGKASL